MEGCAFCAIVAGRAPAHRLLEDEPTVSLLSIEPATVGHALVVPRYRADEHQPP
jgi:histidine triad (HIT) family protein